ncbi:MAG: thioredoxin [Bacteroidia bacterium]
MNKLRIALWSLGLILFAACGGGESKDEHGVTLLPATEFNEQLEALSTYTLIDVRTPEEFAMNHIESAQNINVNGASFESKIALLDKSIPVLVYCKSGGRSATASAQLSAAGFETYELEGGILNWQSQGLAIEAKKPKGNSGYTLEAYNEAVASNGLVLVDFYATWCGPCKRMEPHVEALKEEYKEALKVVKVDTDKSIEVSNHFKVSSIPMVKLYKNGEEVYSKMGYHSKEALEELIVKHS